MSNKNLKKIVNTKNKKNTKKISRKNLKNKTLNLKGGGLDNTLFGFLCENPYIGPILKKLSLCDKVEQNGTYNENAVNGPLTPKHGDETNGVIINFEPKKMVNKRN